MISYSRQDVLRILQISSRQLQGWERAGLITSRENYSFQDLGQLRTLRSLREEDVSAASIRHSIVAMKAVAGMPNPLQEASLVRTGTRLAFRCDGAMVDPIRRQLLFDFDRMDQQLAAPEVCQCGGRPHPIPPVCRISSSRQFKLRKWGTNSAQSRSMKNACPGSGYAPAYINLGTIYFHLRQFNRAEELYRRATETDPSYVLAFFDLGNVLDELERPDESIAAYQRSIVLSPRYADAHYNLALAFERKGDRRAALRHWQAYVRLDKSGPWAEHARGQIRKLLDREKLTIAWRADGYISSA